MEKRQVGRPRAAEPMESVNVKLPRSVAETLTRRALAEDRPRSAYLRRLILRVVRAEDGEAVA
jgi:hypothetical protein